MNEYLRFDYRYNRISLGSGYDTCVLTNQTLAIMILGNPILITN